MYLLILAEDVTQVSQYLIEKGGRGSGEDSLHQFGIQSENLVHTDPTALWQRTIKQSSMAQDQGTFNRGHGGNSQADKIAMPIRYGEYQHRPSFSRRKIGKRKGYQNQITG